MHKVCSWTSHAQFADSPSQTPGQLPWPNTTLSFLPTTGTIGNTNYVAISYNSASLFGSLVVANFIGSMGAQYSRRSTLPPGIGTIQSYNPSCAAVVQGLWSVPFAQLSTFSTTPSPAALGACFLYAEFPPCSHCPPKAAAFVPEIDPNYANQMQIDWTYCVLQNLSNATGPGGSGVACFE
jgi:hypothetical protein